MTLRQNGGPLLRHLIQHFGIDLAGLAVYTEAASGAYLLAPVLAAMAGADRVVAQTRDSRFATASDVHTATIEAAEAFGVADRIEVVDRRCRRRLAQSDVVTNSGFVRPVDRDLVAALKPTAVIPLMWETWEFRASDFDLAACREKGILVLGTNEREPPCDMRPFVGLTALKLLFELGYDGGRVLLLGNASLPGGTVVDHLRRLGIDVTWASADPEGDLAYEALPAHFDAHGAGYDALLVAEHRDHRLLLGPGGLLEAGAVAAVNPALKLGVLCGHVDAAALRAAGLRHLPGVVAPPGFMSYQPYHLGPRPVLTLFAAGLKVGEAMARARRRGLSPRDAAAEALATSPAMDFAEGLAWN